MDYLSVKHAVDSFDKRNGADCIRIGKVLLYSNGARREPTPLGLLEEPPANPMVRSQLKLLYQQELLRRATEEFNETKHAYERECNARSRMKDPPLNHQDTTQQLRRLLAHVRSLQKRVKAAECELDRNTPEHVKRARACGASNQQANEALWEEVSKIRI